eukprot:Gb_37603 [translate_table: standard]
MYLKEEVVSNHDKIMSSFFAQPDAPAYGKTSKELRNQKVVDHLITHKTLFGNPPSLSILLPSLITYTVGQLLGAVGLVTLLIARIRSRSPSSKELCSSSNYPKVQLKAFQWRIQLKIKYQEGAIHTSPKVGTILITKNNRGHYEKTSGNNHGYNKNVFDGMKMVFGVKFMLMMGGIQNLMVPRALLQNYGEFDDYEKLRRVNFSSLANSRNSKTVSVVPKIKIRQGDLGNVKTTMVVPKIERQQDGRTPVPSSYDLSFSQIHSKSCAINKQTRCSVLGVAAICNEAQHFRI